MSAALRTQLFGSARTIRVRVLCPYDNGVYEALLQKGRFVLRRTLPGCSPEKKVVDFWTAVRAVLQYRRWARGLAV